MITLIPLTKKGKIKKISQGGFPNLVLLEKLETDSELRMQAGQNIDNSLRGLDLTITSDYSIPLTSANIKRILNLPSTYYYHDGGIYSGLTKTVQRYATERDSATKRSNRGLAA